MSKAVTSHPTPFRERSKLTVKTIKTWYLVHKWTSLICTLFLLMLCVTGFFLIFHHEIDHALGNTVDPPELAKLAGTTTRVNRDEIVNAASIKGSPLKAKYVLVDPDEPDSFSVSLGKKVEDDAIDAFYTYDNRTGKLLSEYPVNKGFMNLMFRLHVDLFAGLYGMLFLGLMGFLLLASVVSGVFLYGPFMKRTAFGTVRKSGSPRMKWLDVHNLLGIVTLIWLLVVGATGVINTLAMPIYGIWQLSIAELLVPYKNTPPVKGPVSADRALAAAASATPDHELWWAAFPGNKYATPHHFIAYMRGKTPLTSKLITPVMVDAKTYQAVKTIERPWYVTALLVSQPLHFGDYGGLPLKIIWAALDILSIILIGSGLYLWIKKFRIPFEEQITTTSTENEQLTTH